MLAALLADTADAGQMLSSTKNLAESTKQLLTAVLPEENAVSLPVHFHVLYPSLLLKKWDCWCLIVIFFFFFFMLLKVCW